MNIAQRWISKVATTACFVSLAILLPACSTIAEDLEDCPQPFELTVRAIDIANQDITSDGSVENVILFTFDESGKRIDKVLLNAEEIKSRKPIHIEHYGPKSLTFVAWGNVTPKDLERLESVQRIEDVQMPLVRHEGFAQYPSDLFSGRLDREQVYGKLELGEPATIDIYRRTCQVNVIILGYEQWLDRQGYKQQAFDPTDYAATRVLFGNSLDNYHIDDIYQGNPIGYRLTGQLDSATGDYRIAPFRVYPPIEGKPFALDLYVGDKRLESFTKDSRGTLILPEIGKMLNVLIDMRSADASVQIVVTPWNIVHQFVIY